MPVLLVIKVGYFRYQTGFAGGIRTIVGAIFLLLRQSHTRNYSILALYE